MDRWSATMERKRSMSAARSRLSWTARSAGPVSAPVDSAVISWVATLRCMPTGVFSFLILWSGFLPRRGFRHPTYSSTREAPLSSKSTSTRSFGGPPLPNLVTATPSQSLAIAREAAALCAGASKAASPPTSSPCVPSIRPQPPFAPASADLRGVAPPVPSTAGAPRSCLSCAAPPLAPSSHLANSSRQASVRTATFLRISSRLASYSSRRLRCTFGMARPPPHVRVTPQSALGARLRRRTRPSRGHFFFIHLEGFCFFSSFPLPGFFPHFLVHLRFVSGRGFHAS